MTDVMPAVHAAGGHDLAESAWRPVRTRSAGPARWRRSRIIAKDLPASIAIDNRRYGLGGPAMRVHRSGPFLDRLGQDAGSGFGEAFLAGDWDPEPGTDLADLLVPFAEQVEQRGEPAPPPEVGAVAALAGDQVPARRAGEQTGQRARTSAGATT